MLWLGEVPNRGRARDMSTMTATDVQGVVQLVTRRAQRQGYVVSREVREELTQAGLDGTRWKEVVTLAGAALRYQRGRYYYSTPVTPRVQAEQSHQRAVEFAVRDLLRLPSPGGTSAASGRRTEERTDYVQPVTVLTEDR